jgi:hypothetical protein
MPPTLPKRGLLRSVPQRLSSEAARILEQANLGDHFKGPGDLGTPPPDSRQLAEAATNKVNEHWDDAQQYSVGQEIAPAGIVREAVRDLGTARAANYANRALWENLGSDYTNKFRGTATGRRPAYLYEGSVRTSLGTDPRDTPLMGVGDNVTVTRATPWNLMDAMTGSKARSDELVTRWAERNAPMGANGAAIYHLEDLPKHLTTPWLIFRDTKDGFKALDDTQGFADPVSKQIYLNRSGDPYATNFSYGNSPGPFNVGWHEFIHSMQDTVPPPLSFIQGQKTRPAITDRKFDIPGQAGYLGGDGRELGNLLFQLKRQTEITNPNMRDVGASRESLGQWMDWTRRYQTGRADPIIDLPGHPLEGQRAHGFDESIQMLQQILEATGQEGLRDIDNVNWKTGQTASPIKTALLA